MLMEDIIQKRQPLHMDMGSKVPELRVLDKIPLPH